MYKMLPNWEAHQPLSAQGFFIPEGWTSPHLLPSWNSSKLWIPRRKASVQHTSSCRSSDLLLYFREWWKPSRNLYSHMFKPKADFISKSFKEQKSQVNCVNSFLPQKREQGMIRLEVKSLNLGGSTALSSKSLSVWQWCAGNSGAGIT